MDTQIDSSKGLLIAFPRDDAKRLFASKGDATLTNFLSEHLKEIPSEQVLNLQGKWLAIHGSLCEGNTSPSAGAMPLNHCILGGRPLYSGDDKLANLVRPDIVAHVATALAEFEPSKAKAGYDAIQDPVYKTSDDDFQAISQLLLNVADFYKAAANAHAAVLFYRA